MPQLFSTTSNSPESTMETGIFLASQIGKGDVLCLSGELGAGKTTLVKGIISTLAKCPPANVTSPTFSYMHVYPGPTTIYHFDLYRLEQADDFLEKGFIDFLQPHHICLIEWPEKISSLLPPHALHLKIEYSTDMQRMITLEAP